MKTNPLLVLMESRMRGDSQAGSQGSGEETNGRQGRQWRLAAEPASGTQT